MDTKRLIIGLALAMAVMLVWDRLGTYLDQKHPEWGLRNPKTATEQVTPATTVPVAPVVPIAPTTTVTASTTAPGVVVLPQPVVAAPPSVLTTGPSVSGVSAIAATSQPSDVIIGSVDKNNEKYALAIDLSPVGAGIDSVTLNEYKRAVNKPEPYVFQQPYPGLENASRPLATRWITVDGIKVDLESMTWAVASQSQGAATFTLDITGADGPLVRLTRTYTLTDKKAESANAGGYEVKVDLSFENLAKRPLQLAAAFNGTTPPANENDRQPDQRIMAGYLNGPYVVIGHNLVTEYNTGTPWRDITKSADKGYALAWVGSGNGYFNGLLQPLPATGAVNGPYVAKVVAAAFKPEAADYHHDVNITIETTTLSVPAGGSVNLPMRAFFFPKKRDLLSGDYLQAAPLAFHDTLVLTSDWCGVCTFQWLINVLVWMLRMFHTVLFDWGLAIIALVGVVRLLLHPITKKSQVSMMAMGKMGPELERLKKKYGDDKEGLNKAMMGFYKEQGATPILGCLPMFLQMPIWIALYSSLQSTFELRQSPFLQFGGIKLTWIEDLAHPDRLFYFPQHAVNIFGFFKIDAFNVLPFLLAVVFWLQTKYTPKPPATTPEQLQQQKMMQWMTLLFPVFLYNGPAGLNLYILTSTTIGIIESKIIRKHIREKEEAEKNGVVIVDAPSLSSPPPKGGVRRVEPKKPQGGGVMGWFAQLQQKAEELKREADKKKK